MATFGQPHAWCTREAPSGQRNAHAQRAVGGSHTGIDRCSNASMAGRAALRVGSYHRPRWLSIDFFGNDLAPCAESGDKGDNRGLPVLADRSPRTFLAAAIGWSTLARGVRQSPRPHRRRLIALSYVPLIAFVADLGLFVARQTQTADSFVSHGPGPPVPLGGHPAAAHALLIALWAVFLVGVLASVFSIVIVTKHVNLPMLSLRSGKRIAGFTACSLTLMASLAIAGAIAGSYRSRLVPSLGHFLYGGHYSAGTYLVVLPEWWLSAVPLALAAVISLSGWRSARRAWRTTLWLTESV